MSQTPFLQLYVADYLADTLDLTTEQHGAYLLLLMTMWRHDARLPMDHQKLARIARVNPRRWSKIWEGIERFFYEEDGFIRNKRLDQEHQKAISISQKRSAAGEKGGRAKALKNNEPPVANATDLPKHSHISDIREEKETPNGVSKKKGSRLPADWVPDEVFARSQGLSAWETETEAEKFRDYWAAQPGQRGVKLDWDATWRNWVRKVAGGRKRVEDDPRKRIPGFCFG